MGASDWAGRKVREMKEEFGVGEDRALRITGLVRRIISNPGYRELRASDAYNRDEFRDIFTQNLIKSLKMEEPDTVEEKWNSLVRKRGFHHVSGVDVYLGPWRDEMSYRGFELFDDDAVFENSEGDVMTKSQISEEAWEGEEEVNRVERGFLVGEELYEFSKYLEQTYLTKRGSSSEWPWRAVNSLQSEFEVERRRARRVTDLVRAFEEDPELSELARKTVVGDERFSRIFKRHLTQSLKKQEGVTIEEKWNSLAQEYNLDVVAGEEVYLGRYPDGHSFSKRAVFENQEGNQVTMAQIKYERQKEVAKAKGFSPDSVWDEISRAERGYLLDGVRYWFVGYDESISDIQDVPDKYRPGSSGRGEKGGVSERHNESGDGEERDLEKLADRIWEQAFRNPDEVDLDDIDRVLSEPVLPAEAHAKAVRGLTRKAVEEDHEVALGRPRRDEVEPDVVHDRLVVGPGSRLGDHVRVDGLRPVKRSRRHRDGPNRRSAVRTP